MTMGQETKNYSKINKNAVKTWIIARGIGSILFLGAYFIAVYLFLIPKFGGYSVIRYGINPITLLLVFLCVLDTFIFPFMEYKQWRYGIFEDKIELIEGIFIRERTIIPISRVQNLKIEQGPIQRKYGLNSIKIVLAGGEYKIPALTNEEAEKITENLKNSIEIGERVE